MNDAHAVLVLPGFLTGDSYMSSLRERIEQAGHRAYTWDGGYNMGVDTKQAARLERRVEEIYRQNGNRKITLLGYSLGGIYAREIARKHPGMVRQVITMGTPFIFEPGSTDAKRGEKIFCAFNQNCPPVNITALMALPPPVPTSSLYSKGDLVVTWRMSVNPPASHGKNIEVEAGHLMMPFSEAVGRVILDLLKEGPRPAPSKVPAP